jgi:ClpP class serine protease
VAEYRGLTPEQVMATEAALYRGKAGIAAGLADRLQSPQDAVDHISRAVANSRVMRQQGRIGLRAAALNIQTRL